MRARVPLLVLALLAAALVPAAGCARRGHRAATRASVVALLGDDPVEYADFAAYVKRSAGEGPTAVSPRVASSLLDQLLEERLLDLAVAETLPPAKGTTAAERRRDVIGRRAQLAAIDEAELRKAYAADPARWLRPDLLRLSQLLLPTREKAEEARRALAKGTPWLAVSRSLSVAPNAAAGGGLGTVSRGDLPVEFEKAVWKLPAGAFSAPVATPHGVHLFRAEERLSGSRVPFEEARSVLRLEVAEARSTAAVAALGAEAKKAHPPAVIEEHLPFPYVGALPRHSLDSRP